MVASRDAFFAAPFAAPFAQRALVADAGLGWSLPRRLGQQRAARLLLLGERLPAEEAHTLGLVTHLADPGQALPDSLEVAGHLAAGPADSIALTKSPLHRGGHLSLDTYLDEEHLACALNGHGRDAAESRAAPRANSPSSLGRRRPPSAPEESRCPPPRSTRPAPATSRRPVLAGPSPAYGSWSA